MIARSHATVAGSCSGFFSGTNPTVCSRASELRHEGTPHFSHKPKDPKREEFYVLVDKELLQHLTRRAVP
jgi:hypothetical protein